jgi:hypothetical protein
MEVVMDPIAKLLTNLEYDAYAWNRDKSPNITPNSWMKIFGADVYAFEARYQADKMIERVSK